MHYCKWMKELIHVSIVPWTEQHARVRDVDLEAAEEWETFFFFHNKLTFLL